MPDTSARLSLPYLLPSQAQKHVTHNEALQQLDILVQLTLQEIGATAPPAAPAAGDVFATGTGATGAWAGQDGQLAAFQDDTWVFLTPRDGWLAHNLADGLLYSHGPGGWQKTGIDTQNMDGVGINSSWDATNRLAVAADATLFSHDGQGHQLKLNKAGAADTASLMFQDGWSGRAEIGLAGTDNLSVKTSTDGSSWVEAAIFDSASGAVGFGDGQVPQHGGHLRVADAQAGNAMVELQAGDANADVHASIAHASAGASSQLVFSAVAPDNIALIDFQPTDDGTTGVSTRFFRASDTVGNATCTIHKADGTAGYEHRLSANSASVLSLSHNLGIGTASPNAKLSVQGNVTPGADNAFSLGSASYRWSSVWAANGTIQTSDSRDKHVEDTVTAELAVEMIRQVDPVFFKWKTGGSRISSEPGENPVPINAQEIEAAGNDPIEPHDVAPLYLHSGQGQRRHAGFLAQDIKQAMDRLGVDFGAWGIEDIENHDSRQFLRPDQLIPILWSAIRYLLEQHGAADATRA